MPKFDLACIPEWMNETTLSERRFSSLEHMEDKKWCSKLMWDLPTVLKALSGKKVKTMYGLGSHHHGFIYVNSRFYL